MAGVPKTAYDIQALRDEYGQFEVSVETFAVSNEKYVAVQSSLQNDALGGARVRICRERDQRQLLLVSNRGEDGWDVPGGAREPGESTESTARREVSEEVGLQVTIKSVLHVFEFGFVPDAGDGDRISGLWVYFEGTLADQPASVEIQTEELDDARWFCEIPTRLNPHAAGIVRGGFETD